MPSGLYARDGFDGTGDGPVGATVRRHRRALLAVFLLVSAVFTALAASIDFTALVPASVRGPSLAARPLSNLRLAVEVGLLAGASAAALTLGSLLRRDARVRPARGRRLVASAPAAFLLGAVAGRAALPIVVERLAASAAAAVPVLGPYDVAEVWLFFPVALGLAAATPLLLLAAVRTGVVGRFTSTRERGYAALAFVLFAACFSPPDGATFVLYAAPMFAGFAVALAWLEFR